MLSPKSRPRSVKGAGFDGVNRALMLGAVLAVWMLGLIGRLYYLEVIDYVQLLSRAEHQQQRVVELAPQRGAIYDREMHPLAMTLPVDSVFAVPAEISDRSGTARRLASVLKLDSNDLLGRFEAFRSFCWVKRKVSTDEAAEVKTLNLKGIYFQKEMKRFYPKGELASQVLGYVGMDDQGLAGLEFGANNDVAGTPGHMVLETDARRQSFDSNESPGLPGKSLVLTLDENIQYTAETALDETVHKYHAAGGTIVVQNPNTGEILALASYPKFDPNTYSKFRASDWKNRGVAWVFEPGSTFKLVTLSAALEEGLASPNEWVDCQQGRIVLAGHTIHDHKPFGALTVEQVLVNSSDVGAIKIGLRLGEERFYRYIRSFGFGQPTGVELPGEEHGLLKPPSRWSGISIGEISIGQEIGVTSVQLLTAYSAVANGGILYPPRIVRDVYRGDAHETAPPIQGRRVVSVRIAETMKEMLMQVVEQGTGKAARLDGYTAGGKTGTAQKIDPNGHYSHTHYVASFVGFAPVRRPEIAVLVAIDSPVGAIYGQEVAAPAFRSVVEQTLGYLNVPQDNPSRWLQLAAQPPVRSPRQIREGRAGFLLSDSEPTGAAASPVQSVSLQKNLEGAEISDLRSQISDFKSPISNLKSGDHPRPTTEMLSAGPRVAVPDFTGLAVRSAAEKCETLGLDLVVAGSGLGHKQKPAAGALVPAHSAVWVEFSR